MTSALSAFLGNGGDEEVFEKTIEDPIVPLSKDLKLAAVHLSAAEARYLVDYYYQIQNYRIRSKNQLDASSIGREPNLFLEWSAKNMSRTETTVQNALRDWSLANPVGQWSMGIFGIGPVISAGLLAHIDIAKASTAGHIYSFAGISGQVVVWKNRQVVEAMLKEMFSSQSSIVDFDTEAMQVICQRFNRNPVEIMASIRRAAEQFALAEDGDAEDLELVESGLYPRKRVVAALARRPYNALLKTLMFKIGNCFVKLGGSNKDVYGHFYREYRERQEHLNETGAFAEVAREMLTKFTKDTSSRKYYLAGKLPPAQIYMRSLRYCTKMFISHWHTVAYFVANGELPRNPYAAEYLDHMTIYAVPNADAIPGLADAQRVRGWQTIPWLR